MEAESPREENSWKKPLILPSLPRRLMISLYSVTQLSLCGHLSKLDPKAQGITGSILC
jgi:hypothetical protein